MANEYKGEYPVEGTPYVFRFTYNSLCELESKVDLNLLQVLLRMQNPRLSDIRLFCWAGLMDSIPDLTLEQAGDIIVEVGYKKISAAIIPALAVALNSETQVADQGEALTVETETTG